MPATHSQSTADAILPTGSLRDFRVHMVGVGGSGMSGLAALLLKHGARVSGVDATPSPLLAQLRSLGAKVALESDQTPLLPETQLVVSSAAVPEHHADLATAAARGVRCVRYAALLGAMMARYDGIAVSGTHGKSTTSAWIAYVLSRAGCDPSFVIGAVARQLGGGSGVGSGRHFVAEACEYQRSFLNLQPRVAAILNIEEDHLDYYRDLAEIQQAFRDFVGRLSAGGTLVINADDAACRGLMLNGGPAVETFGQGDDANWRACDLQLEHGRYSFELRWHGESLGRLRVGLPGRHNVMNALAVVAVCRAAAVPLAEIVAPLAEYRGVGRRLEVRGTPQNRTIIDDYAHHPTEIRATLAATRERFAPQRLWCVFQPHQHSRTRFLLEDFAASFAQADRIIVPDIYFVRDSSRDREAVRAEDLVERIRAAGGEASHESSFERIVEQLATEAAPGDVVLTMGAGTIWKVADDLVRRLGGEVPA